MVAAARRIIDTEGLDRLTMRRLADEVHSAPMALYHHVRNKDDLLLLVMADFAATMPRPSLPADPLERVAEIFTTLHDEFRRCPWVVEVLASDDLMNEAGLWFVDRILTAFTDAGLSIAHAVQAYRTVWYYTVGEIIVRATAERRAVTSQQPSHRDALFATIDADSYPTLATVATDWPTRTSHDAYRDGLRALLAGLLA